MGSVAFTCCYVDESPVLEVPALNCLEKDLDSNFSVEEPPVIASPSKDVDSQEHNSAVVAPVAVPPISTVAADADVPASPTADPPQLSLLDLEAAKLPLAQKFAGKWKLTDSTNMDAFMVAMNCGYMMRKAASAMSYGVGKAYCTVSVTTGVNMSFDNTGPRKYTQNINIGLECKPVSQTISLPEGPETGTVVWAGDKIYIVMATGMTQERVVNADGKQVWTMRIGDVVAERIYCKD